MGGLAGFAMQHWQRCATNETNPGNPLKLQSVLSDRINERSRKLRPAINPPPSEAASHANYLTACLFALEPSIESLIEAAMKSGWKREYVLLAIMAIALNDSSANGSSSQPLHS
ncbi:hypothetical protein [uncultured Rhizobium sp.]|uniref:hypothetical protein n=1 Tax=uncultured Rhizobium sp. TaxID=155567 RepID=UPI0018CF631C|nr:hypothetical protein [uncultured Rhizobium sp.]